MMGSVPLINYPTIECLQPLEHGKHCLYYRPERGGLTDAVKSALRDRELLLKIAREGRAHILEHHTGKQLARHVLQKAGLLAQAEAFLMED
jgi:glycosyltransferase involved in cell wall biosynthesis